MMFRFIFFVFSLISAVTGNPVVAQSNTPKQKIVRLKALKYIKKGMSTGTTLGTTIPAVKELTKIPSEINTMNTRVDTDQTTELPSVVIQTINPPYDMWSYSDLFDNIESNNIISVSIHQDSKYLYAIDSSKTHELSFQNIHYVTTFPSHMNELIDKLLLYNVRFDIFN